MGANPVSWMLRVSLRVGALWLTETAWVSPRAVGVPSALKGWNCPGEVSTMGITARRAMLAEVGRLITAWVSRPSETLGRRVRLAEPVRVGIWVPMPGGGEMVQPMMPSPRAEMRTKGREWVSRIIGESSRRQGDSEVMSGAVLS
ncbi:hypothetical protein D3C72_1703750 [compost metagenome]